MEDLTLKEWPLFPVAACPGIVGEFVTLATRDSEADPAAVCITMLTRFAAEIYGYAEGKGPYIHVGETIHPPRLFAVICGNSSKARKGTSLYPVNTLFSRQYCLAADMRPLPLPCGAMPRHRHCISLATRPLSGCDIPCRAVDRNESEYAYRAPKKKRGILGGMLIDIKKYIK
jgi:hypothetical protein